MSSVFNFHFYCVHFFPWVGKGGQTVDAGRRDDRTTHLMLDLISCHVIYPLISLSSPQMSFTSLPIYTRTLVSLFI